MTNPTDEQLADVLEELGALCDKPRTMTYSDSGEQCRYAAARIRELSAKVAELEKDRERLDWLDKESISDDYGDFALPALGWAGQGIRQAIDEARDG